MILKEIKVQSGNMGMRTNCYIIIDEQTKRAMIIDPGGESEKILQYIEENDLIIEYIVLTHCHADHIASVKEIREKTDGRICIHRLDSIGLMDKTYSLADYVEVDNPNINAEILLNEDDILTVGSLRFKVIHTPGHTQGSICLYGNDILISGDTLFNGAWGRTDLPTSSFEDIIGSIVNKLMILPDNTIVYPGHGISTIIKDEKPMYLELR
ncbi:MAG: MBL fold metallo-hydrolase [Clostridiales bacterium]|nr:MBL fold metallo-hydrolase [Clostridiales bacterium]